MAMMLVSTLGPSKFGPVPQNPMLTRRFDVSGIQDFPVGLKLLAPGPPIVLGFTIHVWVLAPDPVKAVNFYKEALGAQVHCSGTTHLSPVHAELKLQGGQINIVIFDRPDAELYGACHQSEGFFVDDIKEALDRALNAGALLVEGISKYEYDGRDKNVRLSKEMAKYADDVLMARVKDPYGVLWTLLSLPPRGYFTNLSKLWSFFFM